MEEFKIRQQYIRANNELNRGVNMDSFIKGNQKKVELNSRLDEISISSGQSFSGNIVRQNILNNSASCATNNVNSISYDSSIKFDDNTNASLSLKNGINRGRETMNSFNQNNTNINNKFNNFNRNI